MIPDFLLNRSFLPLTTERLILRPLQVQDADAMATLANDSRVAQRLQHLPHPYTLADAHTFINSSQEALKKGTGLSLAIIRRADQTFMGVIGYKEELGYWLGHEFWRQSYGKEAARSLIKFIFFVLQKNILSGTALTDNIASRRIFEGLGFHQTGTKDCISLGYEGTKLGVTYELSRKDFLSHYRSLNRPILWAVSAVLVNERGELLLTERPPGKSMAGVWEVPGGKIEPGETPEEALIRELKEEVGIDVEEEDLTSLSFISFPYESFHLVMPFYLCRRWTGTPYGAEGQAIKWVKYSDLVDFPMPLASLLSFYHLEDMLKTKEI